MEHRHIPSPDQNGIPDKKTLFLRGENSLIKNAWYSRCAICGERIRPPKLLRLWPLMVVALCIPSCFGFVYLMQHTAHENAALYYCLSLAGYVALFAISKALLHVCYAFGKWRSFPKGLKGEELYRREDRPSRASTYFRAAFCVVYAAAVLALLFFGPTWFGR